MQIHDLRIALFSGNYNMVRDGPTQALNRLVDYMLKRGAAVRIYAPTILNPAHPATGDLIHVPALPILGRSEYKLSFGLPPRVRQDLAKFAPNVLHVASPDPAGHRAVTWARHNNLPILASVHTRFETYLQYYKMAWAEPLAETMLRRFYRRCSALVAPSDSMVKLLHDQRMNDDISTWSRGVDREIFHPERRSLAWRRSFGISDEEVVIGFLGRLVKEKGLDVYSDTIDELRRRGIRHKVVVVGEGPARGWLEARLPGGCFVGFQAGEDLGRAVASMDVLFNPSVTETFGNVTLEAMACGLPVVAAIASGSRNLVDDGVSGRLIRPGEVHQFAEALKSYIEEPERRVAHGAAGEVRSLDFSWDMVNQEMADTYIRLVRRSGEKAAQ